MVPLDSFELPIETHKFMLRQQHELHGLANTNLELPDDVGLIRFVQGANLTDATSTQRLVIRLQLNVPTTVSLSVWDDAAATFRAHLSDADRTNSVMIVTTVNPKLFGGSLFLNSTPATRFFFDASIPVIREFTHSLPDAAATPYTLADTSDSVNKHEMVPIEYLYKYISLATEQTQDADFLCKTRVVGILENNGWTYISCAGCSRKLDKYGSTLRCSKCVSPVVTGVVRYRVELAVHDGEDAATFVVFDKEMTKLTNKTASTLMVESETNDTDDILPKCLKELAGKKFLFKLRLTPFNFSNKHRTFTVSTMTHDDSEEEQLPLPPLSNLDLNGPANSEVGEGINLALKDASDSDERPHDEVVGVPSETVRHTIKRGTKRDSPDDVAGGPMTKKARG